LTEKKRVQGGGGAGGEEEGGDPSQDPGTRTQAEGRHSTD